MPFHLFLDFMSSCHGDFFSQHNGLFPPSTLLIVIFWVIFWVSSLPMSVTTHSNCCLHKNYFDERSYFCHIPPLGSLLMESSSAVAMTPLMATDLAPLLAAGIPPVKIRPGSLYNGELLIALFVLDHYTTVPR